MNIADTITRHASERPYSVAIIENDAVVHYGTLERAVWAAAVHLRQSGIVPGEVVGVSLPHSALYLVAVYALARIGAVYVSLPLSDPLPMRAAYATRFGVKWVVAASDNAGPSGVPTVVLQPGHLSKPSVPIPADLRFAGGDHPWFIRRTSGTTGEAKGVVYTHRADLREFQSRAAYYPGPDDRYLAIIDMYMSVGLLHCAKTLFGGGAIVIAKLPTPAQMVIDLIDRYAITRLVLAPNHFDTLLPLSPREGCRCPTIKEVTVTGMAVPEKLRREVRHRFSPNLWIRYGINEVSPVTLADAAMQEKFPETVGAVLPGVELEIVDEHDRPVPRGEPGRIRVRTPWMPTGYLNLPGAADRVFRNGWAYLGDIGVLSPEGMLFLKGREDDMMNFDGIKIMPADIEEALLQHPAVKEAAAFPASSQRHQHIPMAAVTISAAVTPEVLLAHARQLLGVRAPLLISIEQALPRNAMGKVVKRELALRLEEKLPASLR
ncbi:MAG: class I adenylate-forming enzyme family protein [Rhodospirillales bacterium]